MCPANTSDVVRQIEAYMLEAVEPDERYPVGVEYTGRAIWKRTDTLPRPAAE